MFRTELE